MAFCSRFTAILVTKKDAKLGKMVRARCKQWDCSFCARQNKLAWRKTLYEYLMNNPDKLWSFHTFTFHFRKMNRYARLIYSVNRIKKNWEKLLKRIKRRYGKFEYVRILEPHKLGGYHIHLMASFVIPDCDIAYRTDKKTGSKIPYLKWLKSDLPSLGYGYIQHSENITGNGAQAVTYVTKYMTKDELQSYELLKGNKIRYVQTSRGIKSPFASGDNDENWVLRHSLNFMDFMDCEDFIDLNKKTHITIDDLEKNGGAYPNYDEDKQE